MSAATETLPKSLERFVLIVVACIAIGVLPLYLTELNVLTKLSMYQFFPLVYGFVGYVGWNRWQAASGTVGHRAGQSWLPEWLCLGMAFGFLVVHAGLFGPWLGGAAGLAALAAGVFALGRLRRVQLWDLWALLVISSRLPLNLNNRLAATLQSLSSELSSLTLDALGVVHVLAGNIVKLPAGELFVAEACSGIVSVMSVIACAAILAVWSDRPLLRSVVLVAIGVLYAMLMNSVRIVIIAAARSGLDIDLSHGWIHEVLGVMVFFVTFACLLSTDYILMRFLYPNEDEAVAEGESAPVAASRLRSALDYRLFPSPPRLENPSRSGASFPGPGTRLKWMALAVVAVLLGGYHSFALYTSFRQDAGLSVGIVALAKDIDSDAVAAAVAPWTIAKEDLEERDTLSELAPFSKVYTLRHPTIEHELTLSIDFPFYRKWHDVCHCYVRGGWKMLRREIRRDSAPSDLEDCEYISADFINPSKGHGQLVFANLNEDGKLVAPPPDFGDFGYLINQVIHLFQQPRQVSLNPNKLFQVQVFSTEPVDQSPELRHEIEQVFFRSFREVRRFLVTSREEIQP